MVKYYNRKTKCLEEEKVAGGKCIDWIYSSPIGMNVLEMIIKKRWLSALAGRYSNSSLSKKRIESFINKFQIDMKEYQGNPKEYKSFNEFFSRKIKEGARKIDLAPSILISCGDGRALAYDKISSQQEIPIKGMSCTLGQILQEEELASEYQAASCFVLRLSPTDYHRFHFVDSGVCEDTRHIWGSFYSVNPKALKSIQDVFCRNEREVSIFHSDHFGKIIYVEVGATFVGSIYQTFSKDQRVNKGEEKGYFCFGGSTVILFFQENRVQFDEDLIQQTQKGIETKVMMGEQIGINIHSSKK